MASTDEVFAQLAEGVLKRQEVAEAQLALARKKEEREAEQAKAELEMKKTDKALALLESNDPQVRKLGEALLCEVATAKGVIF